MTYTNSFSAQHPGVPPTTPIGYTNHDNTGVSNDAGYLRNRIDNVAESNAMTYLRLKHEIDLLSGLLDAILAARHDDWDSYGAEPVIPEAIGNALKFIKALPLGVPIPAIATEPDGEIAFDWQSAVDRMFSVSVGASQKISYSGLFGDDDTHGSTFFVSTLPKTVLRAIEKVYAAD
jgi:hypothetical protein